MTTFNKYPKIPNQQKNTLPAGEYTVQEKLDGSNAGIELTSTGDLIIHTRNVALAIVEFEGGRTALQPQFGNFHLFVQQVEEIADAIRGYMVDHGLVHLYGEWLVPHTIQYSQDMYNQFYVFDAVNREQNFVPVPIQGLPDKFLIPRQMNVYLDGSDPDAVRKTTNLVQEKVERRIEGTVWKRYDFDSQGMLDQFGQRYCYKDVLPEFREDHRANPMFPGPLDPLTAEQRVAAHLPDRALEKVYEKLIDANGQWENKLYPAFIGMVWQEFFEEWLIKALQEEKMPTLNTKHLYAIVTTRAREFATERR